MPADLSAVAARIRTTAERLREKQAERLASWTDLYMALGSAQEAAHRGDVAQVRHHLQEASETEWGLLAGCAESDGAIDFLDEQGVSDAV